jgi:hypothetical protein
MESGGKCSICGDGHTAARCPELWAPLREGFFTGGGGGGGGGCDDDCEETAAYRQLLLRGAKKLTVNRPVMVRKARQG